MAMQKGTHYTQKTDEEIIAALEQTHGLLNPAARILGISRNAIGDRVKRNPELEAVRKSCREAALDLAEGQLIESVKKGCFPAIAFMLKTVGKDRGYTEEITINSNNFNQNLDLTKLTTEELEKLNELCDKARTTDTSESDSGRDL